jgi:hypothetical protein
MESEVAVDGTVTATGHRLLSVDLDPTTRDALLKQGTYVGSYVHVMYVHVMYVHVYIQIDVYKCIHTNVLTVLIMT